MRPHTTSGDSGGPLHCAGRTSSGGSSGPAGAVLVGSPTLVNEIEDALHDRAGPPRRRSRSGSVEAGQEHERSRREVGAVRALRCGVGWFGPLQHVQDLREERHEGVVVAIDLEEVRQPLVGDPVIEPDHGDGLDAQQAELRDRREALAIRLARVLGIAADPGEPSMPPE